MTDYYFLISSLPTLEFGKKPPIDFHQLFFSYKMNIEGKDFEKVRRFLLYFDCQNLVNLWREKPLDPWGYLDKKGIDEALLVDTVLPDFVFDFLKKYPEKEQRITYFPELLSSFFKTMIYEEKGFLKDYFVLQRSIRLLKTAFFTEDVGKELFFEDLSDLDIKDLLKRKNNYSDKRFDYKELAKILGNQKLDPLTLYTEYMKFQFYMIDRLLIENPFSIDQLIGYLAKLRIVEEMSKLDKEEGDKIVDEIA